MIDADEESAARDLIETHWTQITHSAPGELALPVDPVQIAGRLGIRVVTVPMSPDKASDMTRQGDYAVIRLNRHDGVTRQRFTCAHALGHWSARKRAGDLSYTFQDARNMMSASVTVPQEIRANRFAAALLMPKSEVVKFDKEGMDQQAMARRFGVSRTAMGWRLVAL